MISVSGEGLSTFPDRWGELLPSMDNAGWSSVYLGVALSFYAFIGFEDMVDVAEEVKDVSRTLPLAIILTLGITTFLYVLLVITAVLSLPPEELAYSTAQLTKLYEYHTGEKAIIVSIIGMFAIINGALIQMIMGSRVLYGLSYRGQLPNLLGIVHHRTRTPLMATAVATVIVLILALVGRLASLAETTSVIMLTVFSILNLALWRIKLRNPFPPDTMIFPIWVPITGFFLSSAFVLSEIVNIFRI